MTLTLLAPTVVVRVEGRPARVSHAQARLLATLAVAHPAPLHVEQASDALWPDTPLETARVRLNSLVRRLRRALGRHGAVVVRDADLVGLDTDRCDADLWRFRRGLSGTTGERIDALGAVRGNLCDAQFPYDERLVAERHRLLADWVRHARLVVEAGHVSPTDFGQALAALGLEPDDVS